jgi:hypothetical protein
VDEFDVVAAFLEQDFGVSSLKIVDADFRAWDMRSDSKNWNTAALAVEQAVDEVQIPRTAASTTDRELPGEMSLGASGESRAFLMPHMNPFNRAIPAQGVRESIERIPNHAVHTLHSRID